MLFAALEIAFFLLVATFLGGAAGWWLARSGKVSVTRAMDRSGAHAAADRELEIARAEIVRLNSKLRVATDAIRELERNETHPAPPAPDLLAIPDVPAAPAELDSSGERVAHQTTSDALHTTIEAVAGDETEVLLEADAVVRDDIEDHGSELDHDDAETATYAAAEAADESVESRTEDDPDEVEAAGPDENGVEDGSDDVRSDDPAPEPASEDTAAGADDAEPADGPSEDGVQDDDARDFVPESARSRGGRRLSSRVAEVAAAARFERPAPTITFDDPSD